VPDARIRCEVCGRGFHSKPAYLHNFDLDKVFSPTSKGIWHLVSTPNVNGDRYVIKGQMKTLLSKKSQRELLKVTSTLA